MITQAIYKYELPINGEEMVETPGTGSRVLSVANQRGKLCVWILCTPGIPATTTHRFYTAMTGEQHHPGDRAQFLGTVQFDEGAFVVHVFERHWEDR